MDAIQALCQIEEQREFEFTADDFTHIQEFMLRETGISLSERKTAMVYGRLARRLRRTGIDNFCEYFDLVRSDLDERVAFINALTTNKTQFFREKHHFDFLSNVLVPEWQQQNKHRIRIWSAGCSTGEEPYTIASSLAAHGLLTSPYDSRILATDLDTQVLDVGRNGTYGIEACKVIPDKELKHGFIRGKGSKQELLKAKPLLQKHIAFKQLNLMATWPHKGPLDAIFCRNVMIYFEREVQQELIYRFWEKLGSGGILFIGHSESIGEMGSRFDNLGQTMFRKP
ncbi:chemotaxis protein CheR [Enterovibrio norvegicus]|uniref:Chemotaxis protein methyltransferase n=1 Tax=Enterovibrio norvegicus TaxID=188144 RepID=A0ABV4L8B1_9GAMM|nr:protein-glutamate O-methyltransferase CheR [Enterovibrio norvegicus]MCC4801099.1 protein-glutamate O-methyltransferase CheR [Enterovibrio norvegicus]OEF53056.1 chemotaxis protein CheR [Enterovibrio norvegicus]PMH72767.1 chemotaxis protein CheR [Enterovibrio norvegicus]PMI27350.1 chemotaxis protein CheR [Enterovibrio norvegicus]PMI36509.1 chemotaxis protein CheR [Enterovibrio norvegicus]